jgi:carboxylate-amine ligase
MVDFGQLLNEIITLVSEDAAALGCVAEVEHARVILRRGTSAHQQTRVYEASLAKDNDPLVAQREVVRYLISQTANGL